MSGCGWNPENTVLGGLARKQGRKEKIWESGKQLLTRKSKFNILERTPNNGR